MMTVTIGNMEPFDPNDDDWESYTERFDIQHATTQQKQKRVPTFLAVVGKSTYKTLKDLCTPKKPN